jgi:hypothetical protein
LGSHKKHQLIHTGVKPFQVRSYFPVKSSSPFIRYHLVTNPWLICLDPDPLKGLDHEIDF